MEHDLFPSEQLVNLLQCEVLCLWVEEVDQWQEAEVEDCEKISFDDSAKAVSASVGKDIHTAEIDVCAITDVADTDWCDFDHKEGEDPVGCRCKSSSSLTDSKRGIFSRNYLRVRF